MSEQKKDNPWDELDIPHGGEISVSELASYKWGKFIPEHRGSGGWTSELLRQELAKELGAGKLVLRGPAQIVKGDQPAIALTVELVDALQTLFDFPLMADVHKQDFFLNVSSSDNDERVVSAKIKGVGGRVTPRTVDHFVISQGLARDLDLKNQDIVIHGYSAGEIADLDMDSI